jgi:hypothetical protein
MCRGALDLPHHVTTQAVTKRLTVMLVAPSRGRKPTPAPILALARCAEDFYLQGSALCRAPEKKRPAGIRRRPLEPASVRGLRTRGHFPESVAHHLNGLNILAANAGEGHETLGSARAPVIVRGSFA